MERWRQSSKTLERQLAAAQQITHIGSWEWDVAGGQVSWSEELYRIYGLEPGSRDINFDVFVSFVHPDDRQRVAGHVREALGRPGRFQWIERIVRADGAVRDLDTVGEVVVDDDGQAVALVGTCRDVTEERRRDESLRRFADICANVQIGLVVLAVTDAERPGDATVISANPAAANAVPAALPGARLADLTPSGRELGKLIAGVARDREVRELAELRLGGDDVHQVFSVKGFPLPGNQVGVAFEERTAEARARRIQTGEQHILEMVAAGATLPDVLATLVRLIEELAPPAIASVLLLDAEGRHLTHGAAPGLPESYTRAIDGSAIGPAAGSCGTAAYEKRPIFVEDIATDPLWKDYRHLALPHDLRACWASPILAEGGRVLGTFALYYREPRGAGAGDLELIARATHIAGLAIQRRELDDQLRALSAHTEAAREQERTGIAREIHDVLGGAMTALKLDLSWIGRRSAGDTPIPPDVLHAKIKDLMLATDTLIQQVRRISAELRPGELDDLGLVAAMESQALEFERRTQVAVTIDTNLAGVRLDRNVSTALFRIFQECLTNVSRHAEATHVDVRLRRSDDRLHFEMRDDGRGISVDAAASPRALGLLGIRERARALGGSAVIGPARPRGTLVSVDLPLLGRAGGGRA